MSIATLTQLKAFLGITDTSEDAVLTYLLNAANSQVEKYIGYNPIRHEVHEVRDGNGRYSLALAHPFPVSVNDVYIDGREIPERTEPTGTGWFLDPARNILWVCGPYVFTEGRGNVELSYNAGFLPMDGALIQAVLDIAATRRDELRRRGITSKSLAGESVSFVHSAIPEGVRGYLDPFRKVTWP